MCGLMPLLAESYLTVQDYNSLVRLSTTCDMVLLGGAVLLTLISMRAAWRETRQLKRRIEALESRLRERDLVEPRASL